MGRYIDGQVSLDRLIKINSETLSAWFGSGQVGRGDKWPGR